MPIWKGFALSWHHTDRVFQKTISEDPTLCVQWAVSRTQKGFCRKRTLRYVLCGHDRAQCSIPYLNVHFWLRRKQPFWKFRDFSIVTRSSMMDCKHFLMERIISTKVCVGLSCLRQPPPKMKPNKASTYRITQTMNYCYPASKLRTHMYSLCDEETTNIRASVLQNTKSKILVVSVPPSAELPASRLLLLYRNWKYRLHS